MSNRSKDRSSLCSFTFVDGRHCRIPRQAGHPSLCAFHARKEAQSLAGQEAGKDIAYHLSGSFVSACDLTSALGRLFSAVAQGQVKPKTASTLVNARGRARTGTGSSPSPSLYSRGAIRRISRLQVKL